MHIGHHDVGSGSGDEIQEFLETLGTVVNKFAVDPYRKGVFGYLVQIC